MEATTTTGELVVSIYQDGDLSPISEAQVEISDMNGNIIRHLQTDEFGNIKTITLPALTNHTRSEVAGGVQSTQGKYIVTVKHPNYEPVRVEGVQIFEGSKAIPEIHLSSSRGEEMTPIKTIKIDDSKPTGVKRPENPFNISELSISPQSFYNTYGVASGYKSSVNPHSFYHTHEFALESESSLPQIGLIIPETLTVQLFNKDRRGRIIGPGRKIVLPFVDYIKGVLHKEINGFTEDEAIRANVLAAVSFTLNRYYTEHYRRQNLDYHVTNDTGVDHDYDENHLANAQEPLVRNIEEFFNKYIKYPDNYFFPFLAQYCNGTTARCANKKWLEQTPSREMAKKGRTHTEILKHYYGSNIDTTFATQIVINNQIYSFISPMKLGDSSETLPIIQHYLDVIGKKYDKEVLSAAIEENGQFGKKTDKAIRLFQEHIMKLPPEKVNGVIDQKTWYVILTRYLAIVNNGNERNGESTPIRSASRLIRTTNLRKSNSPGAFWPNPHYGLVCKTFHTPCGSIQYCYYTYYWEVYHPYYQ
ncbi:hypothetical protein CN533_05070 [Priestia megaterium]|uniref:hypothetical protein n=1 Tax=Priestia megaterium TaxID=1404 RepID=UPI000BF542BB|nr:hypothetical protein [Priestia megaterium]PET72776.1 hypothetical protein CN533_05070 [Priestia megaterium]PFK88896.1 hypothetical protein COJ19_04360 [Priestia megaterium]